MINFFHTCKFICFSFLFLKLGRDLPDEENKSTLQILSVLAGLAVVLTRLAQFQFNLVLLVDDLYFLFFFFFFFFF